MLFYTNSLERFLGLEETGRQIVFMFEVRGFHINLVRFLFLALYFHMWRGLGMGLIYNVVAWRRGGSLFVVFIVISFLGYVLPWGQISFWGAAVISNFFRVIPYIGGGLVFWLWGEFLVGVFTLKLFLFGHFFLSLLSVIFIINHLVRLHLTGSSSKLLISSFLLKTVFFSKIYY